MSTAPVTPTALVTPVTAADYEGCPGTAVVRRSGEKWTMLLLSLLSQRAYGFNELDRAVEGLSRRVLTRTLRILERDGLVSRTPLPDGRVAYALTGLGRSLYGRLRHLAVWAVENEDAVRAAREAFDRA
ncbi:winged helix-turn-helix transcriptional regulator [Actinomadura parmotrematis]|uniref:Helix-turn-helix transcriptional regulator n=1 Tax=Actinomadura parmotrematis TaxID=2864039 RepID=A0ABS7G4E3_9ACTN|nr:helix-turn-helix domain-containing protein [Actinomadura parmotrematis]MBW8487593.1 helix-turn-helix transcriptional regulator [Actinomadura parmotrematis]